MPAMQQHDADSRYAWTRLAVTLALMTIGSGAMYVVAVVLPAVQANAWMQFDGGKAKVSPDTVGIARPQ